MAVLAESARRRFRSARRWARTSSRPRPVSADIQVCYDTGADHVIDWRNDDIVAEVKRLTEGHGADVVYDPVGGDTSMTRACIAFEGRIIVIGFASGRIPEIKAHMILNKNMFVTGFFWTNYQVPRPGQQVPGRDQCSLYSTGKFKPVVSKVIPMPKLPDALDLIAEKHAYGKIVLVNEE